MVLARTIGFKAQRACSGPCGGPRLSALKMSLREQTNEGLVQCLEFITGLDCWTRLMSKFPQLFIGTKHTLKTINAWWCFSFGPNIGSVRSPTDSDMV